LGALEPNGGGAGRGARPGHRRTARLAADGPVCRDKRAAAPIWMAGR
jgi:hypothetical protein